MTMVRIPKFPRKMEELLGTEGKNEFIDFLNDSFQNQGEIVQQTVADKFDRRVTEEVSGLRVTMIGEFANVRQEMTEEFANVRQEMTEEFANIRQEMTEEFANIRQEITEGISNVKVQIADLRSELKSEISSQTQWMFGGILAAATLITVVQPLMQKFLKL